MLSIICSTLKVWARVSALEDVKASANWMWAAKLPGEGGALYRACEALCEAMSAIGRTSTLNLSPEP